MEVTHRTSTYVRSGSDCMIVITVICLILLSTISSGTESVKGGKIGEALSSKHKKYAELTCDDCHMTTTLTGITTDQCLSCHGSFEEVAAVTKNMDPDPHDSPHYGKELDCDLCHHEHSVSENFCAQCHEWELILP